MTHAFLAYLCTLKLMKLSTIAVSGLANTTPGKPRDSRVCFAAQSINEVSNSNISVYFI